MLAKSIAGLLVVSFLLACQSPVVAKDEPKVEKDHFTLYRIAGRKWLQKRTPNPGQEGADTAITFMRYEILNVYDEMAEQSQMSLDQGKKAIEGDPFVIKVKFDKDSIIFKDPIGFQKSKREKVRTDAGSFECILWVKNDGDDGNAKLWRSIDFPSLTVKQSDRFGTREIVEFSWVDGDPGYKSKKKKKKNKKKKKGEEEEPTEEDTKRLYGSKGALWVHQTEITKGERNYRSFKTVQYEVTKVSAEQCEVEVTQLTQLLQKIKGEDPETLVIKFDDTFVDHLEPTELSNKERKEKRLTDVGLFECTVYSFKDDEGRQGHVWYADDWPGLVVRRVIKGDLYKEITGLVKFEE